MISEQIVRVANTPCLLLRGRSGVRIPFGVPEAADFSAFCEKSAAFLHLFEKLVIQGKKPLPVEFCLIKTTFLFFVAEVFIGPLLPIFKFISNPCIQGHSDPFCSEHTDRIPRCSVLWWDIEKRGEICQLVYASSTREALIKSARAGSERFCFQARF